MRTSSKRMGVFIPSIVVTPTNPPEGGFWSKQTPASNNGYQTPKSLTKPSRLQKLQEAPSGYSRYELSTGESTPKRRIRKSKPRECTPHSPTNSGSGNNYLTTSYLSSGNKELSSPDHTPLKELKLLQSPFCRLLDNSDRESRSLYQSLPPDDKASNKSQQYLYSKQKKSMNQLGKPNEENKNNEMSHLLLIQPKEDPELMRNQYLEIAQIFGHSFYSTFNHRDESLINLFVLSK